MRRCRIANVLVLIVAGMALSACATSPSGEEDGRNGERERSAEQVARDAIDDPGTRISARAGREEEEDADDDLEQSQLYPGSGRMFDAEALTDTRRHADGDITLNFENADVREVVAAVMENILEQNYTIASNVDGRITLQTTRPLSEDAVLPIMERVLHMNGVALVEDREEGLWRVMRVEDAARAGHRLRLGRRGGEVPPGYQVQVVPLEYIAASEMETILEPLLSPGAEIRVDRARNLLVVKASSRDMRSVEEAADLFDVDLLEGMSVGLFSLDNIEPGVLADELETLFGSDADGPLAGMFRFVPIERLGAVMVVTPQAEYLEEAQTWVQRLDRSRGEARGRSVYVYRLQNSDAGHVADVLNQLYGVDVGTTGAGGDRLQRERDQRAPQLAPGMTPGTLGSGDTGMGARGAGTMSSGTGGGLSGGSTSRTNPSSNNPSGNSGSGSNSGDGNPDRETASGGNSGNTGDGAPEREGELGDVRVVADTSNNALLIYATSEDYDNIERIIEELDIEPLQVLVDATIVEVTLSDDLRFGLQWMFRDSVDGYSSRGEFATGGGDISRQFPGFNYSVIDAGGDIRAVLSALAEEERVDVLSSPSLMVLDNRTAHLRVGDQVPIRTGETRSAVTDDQVVTSSISFRDTGVLLSVTPRVNAGGMVTMDVLQEVSDVAATESSEIDSPTISTRDIQSTVAVQSGETIVLGGLIRETETSRDIGIPFLMDAPLLGWLFRESRRETRRTELIVMLTPRVASDREGAREITDEFRRRMEGLEDSFQRWDLDAPGSQSD